MIMKTTLNDHNTGSVVQKLSHANSEFAAAYPGDSGERQPVHTVYGGAQLFRSNSADALGRKALETLRRYAPDTAALAEVTGIPTAVATTVYQPAVAQLERQPGGDYGH